MRTKGVEPIRYCRYCGALLERKNFKGRLEDLGVMRRRIYCNRMCMHKGFLNLGINASTERVSRASARLIRVLVLQKTHCELCGVGGQLDTHHTDENCRNNSAYNLMCLCRSCHTKLHRTRGRCSLCDEVAHGLGFCNKHYLRFRKHGDPHTVKYK